MKLRFSKEGLTLVELLVVIGIIAVLAGILWVVFSSVREKARQAGCKNNLHQIWLALQQYRHDYDGLDPDGTPREYWELGLPEGISDLVRTGYLKKPLRCPNDFTPFTHNISPRYVSYGRGWWDDRTSPFRGGAKFCEWIAALGDDFPTILDPYHDPYFFKPNDPDISRNWTLWATFGGAIKAGWYSPPRGSPPIRRDKQ
jgi:prepilin-type N-terminal cleavage/methylation domain-containing protein